MTDNLMCDIIPQRVRSAAKDNRVHASRLPAGRYMKIRIAAIVLLEAIACICGTAGAQEEVSYVGVFRIAAECQLGMFYDDLSNRLRLVSEDLEVVVTPGLDVASMDSEIVKLPARVKLHRGEVHIPESFVNTLKARLEERRDRRRREQATKKEGRKLEKVVLDPGHGGRFPGACAHGLQEKDLNLTVALMVKGMLEEEGLEIIMTRVTDCHLSEDLSTDLDLRCDMTNSKKADIFVSIHANSSTDPTAKGFDVFVARPEDELSRKSAKAARESPITGMGEIDVIVWRALLKEHYTQSMELAGRISKTLEKSIDDINRGVDNEHGFRVIKWTRCPAVLVEMGFMSNRATARRLASRSYLRDIARGIAGGILEFKRRYDETCGFTKPREADAGR